MEVRQESEGFAIYEPSYAKAKAALHASFVAGECRCTVSFFDGVTPVLVDVPFSRAINELQRVGLPRPEQYGGC